MKINNNKTLRLALVAIIAAFFVQSCSKYETYAEKKEKERNAINRFIINNNIRVKSESEFLKDTTTSVTDNEYVLFSSTGIYMQIVRRGCGERLKKNETATVLCRFKEFNILGDSLQLSNLGGVYQYIPEEMSVTMGSGVVKSAVFTANRSLMYSKYNTTAVPNGWLMPFRFINVGRQSKPDDEIAKVKLIVPASQGQSNASTNVYPCHYEITFEKGI